MRSFVSLFLVLTLAACGAPDRKVVDRKMLDACTAAVKALYAPEDTLDVQQKSFSNEKSHDGLDLRRVHLTTHFVRNGGYIEQKDFDCWFEERTGLTGYLIKFYRLDWEGQHYGNVDGKIEGDYAALMKLQQVTEDILLK